MRGVLIFLGIDEETAKRPGDGLFLVYNILMTTLLTPGRIKVAIFTALYMIGFGAWFMSHGNYEFVWYMATMLVIIGIIAGTLRTSQVSDSALWLLSIWGLLHMLGGGLKVGDHVLYAQVLYPFHVDGDFTFLKYDQAVHAFGFGVAAYAIHGVVSRMAPSMRRFGRIMLPALAAMGLSVINEVIEFAAVLALPNTWVGGYYNLELDLVANTLGAFLAVLIIELIAKKKA